MGKNKKKKNKGLGGVTARFDKGVSFFKEAKEELKKVTWPDRQTTIRYTGIVIMASLIVGFVIGGIDYLFQLGIEFIIT